jgi:16S rRNA (cytosine1402-N4)-methyltransferase
MLQEVLEWLRISPDGIYVDATLGAGGHSEAIAESLTSGRLISLDRDAQALQIAQQRLKRFGSKVNCVLSPFSRIVEAVHELGIPKVDGVLADLGVSSMQLDQAERGFSFREAGPLSMRMGVNAEDETLTADEIVNRWPENDMADLFYREADEHDSRRIARAIVRARPIRDTAHLATVVAGSRAQWGRQRSSRAKTFLARDSGESRDGGIGQFLSRLPPP